MANVLSEDDVLKKTESLRVALVHDWLNGMRGGERVLEQVCALLRNVQRPAALAGRFFCF